ncbi:hypothetical protein EJ110_NYTH19261 [Nymphaea thermarum]|nr:hypothetical protein EJ110_NYTH19261 [Nymphaea thermarum]
MTELDVVLWNSMDSGYAQRGRYVEALEVFWLMEEGRVMLGTLVFRTMLWYATPYEKCKSLEEASFQSIKHHLRETAMEMENPLSTSTESNTASVDLAGARVPW